MDLQCQLQRASTAELGMSEREQWERETQETQSNLDCSTYHIPFLFVAANLAGAVKHAAKQTLILGDHNWSVKLGSRGRSPTKLLKVNVFAAARDLNKNVAIPILTVDAFHTPQVDLAKLGELRHEQRPKREPRRQVGLQGWVVHVDAPRNIHHFDPVIRVPPFPGTGKPTDGKEGSR